MDIKLGRVKNRTRTTFASKRLKSSWLIRKQKGLLTWAILTSASLWYRALHSSVLQEWMRSRHILPDTRYTRYMTPHNGKSDLSPVRRQTAYERPLRVHGLSIRPHDLHTQPPHPEGSENTDTAPSTRRGDVPSSVTHNWTLTTPQAANKRYETHATCITKLTTPLTQ